VLKIFGQLTPSTCLRPAKKEQKIFSKKEPACHLDKQRAGKKTAREINS